MTRPGVEETQNPWFQNRYLFEGVVGGNGGHGNCLGIPNAGGEVVFSTAYNGNPGWRGVELAPLASKPSAEYLLGQNTLP